MTDKTLELDEASKTGARPIDNDNADPIVKVADTSLGSEPTSKEGKRDIDNDNADVTPHIDAQAEGHEPTDKQGKRTIDNDNADPMPKLKEGEIDDTEEAKIVLEQETPSVELSEDIKSLLESLDLPTEFKTQALGLFEGAVAARISDIKKEMFAINETKMEEYKIKLAETVEEKSDALVSEAVTKWLEENQTSVKSNIRTQIAESFMANLLNLLESHYISIPEGKEDVLETALAKADELQVKLDETVKEITELKESAIKSQKALVVEASVKSLTDTQAERVRELAESIAFDSQESYATKMTAIVESITKVNVDKASDFLTEDAKGNIEIKEDNKEQANVKAIDPLVANLLADLKRLA
jgi:hypothetical protein